MKGFRPGPAASRHSTSDVERNFRWNFSCGVLDGAFLGFYLVLVDVNLVIPWMLSQLTESRMIIGLAPTIVAVGSSLPQLLVAWLVQTDPFRKHRLLQAAVIRLFVFVPMLPFLFWDLASTSGTLAVFLLCYSLSSLMIAFVGLPWQEMYAKVLPASRLSLFFGLRSFIGGLIGLPAAAFVRSYLGEVQTVPLPKFGVLFAVGAICLLLATSSNAFIREPPGPVSSEREPLGPQLRRAIRLSWDDRDYRHFLVLRALLSVATLTAPLYIVEGRANYGILADSVGTFTMASLLASIAASLGWSLLGDRLRLSGLLRVVALLGIMPPILAILMPVFVVTPIGAYGGWLLVFVLLGAASSGMQNATFRGALELPPPQHRSLMIGLGNTFAGLISLGGPLIGLLADSAGSSASFGLAALATGAVLLFGGSLRRGA